MQPELIPNLETVPGHDLERRLRELWAQHQFVHTLKVLDQGVYQIQWEAASRFRSPGSGHPGPVTAPAGHSEDRIPEQGSMGF